MIFVIMYRPNRVCQLCLGYPHPAQHQKELWKKSSAISFGHGCLQQCGEQHLCRAERELNGGTPPPPRHSHTHSTTTTTTTTPPVHHVGLESLTIKGNSRLNIPSTGLCLYVPFFDPYTIRLWNSLALNMLPMLHQ